MYDPAAMKFGELKSIGHNIADSLAGGIGLLIGHCETDIFGEASRSPEGHIIVDFLKGTTEGARPSESLAQAIALYRHALRNLCYRHGGDVSAFRALRVKFGVHAVYGRHFAVTIEDQKGRQSTDSYVGVPGRRSRVRR
jgi:hypothetical protein